MDLLRTTQQHRNLKTDTHCSLFFLGFFCLFHWFIEEHNILHFSTTDKSHWIYMDRFREKQILKRTFSEPMLCVLPYWAYLNDSGYNLDIYDLVSFICPHIVYTHKQRLSAIAGKASSHNFNQNYTVLKVHYFCNKRVWPQLCWLFGFFLDHLAICNLLTVVLWTRPSLPSAQIRDVIPKILCAADA